MSETQQSHHATSLTEHTAVCSSFACKNPIIWVTTISNNHSSTAIQPQTLGEKQPATTEPSQSIPAQTKQNENKPREK